MKTPRSPFLKRNHHSIVTKELFGKKSFKVDLVTICKSSNRFSSSEGLKSDIFL